MKFINTLYQKKVSSKGLSVFRILFSLVLFFEIFRIFKFRHLYFDPIPFIETSNINFTIPLLVWMGALLCLVFGYFTKIAKIINYILSVFVLTNVGAFEYHMDYAYIGMSFLMLFLPLAEHYSFDVSIRKKESNDNVSVLYYYIPIAVGVGFVYLGSIPFKFTNELWINGLGVWLPASIPQVTILNDQWLLNQKYLMLFLGYFTIFFELVFPFIFFIKKLRPLLFICGFGLHLGILLEFPIPYFALGVMAIYVLLIPNYVWTFIERKLGFISEKKNESNNIKVTDHFRKKEKRTLQLLKLMLVVVCAFQLNAFAKFLFKEDVRTYFSGEGSTPSALFKNLKYANQKLINVSTKTMGVTPHGVFVDGHFRNYNTIYTLRYDGKHLPLYNEDGMPERYVEGGSWVNFNFRVNKPGNSIGSKGLQKGLAHYATFWAHENGIPLEELSLEVLEKEIVVPFQWEKDALINNIMSPWKKVATLSWDETGYRVDKITNTSSNK